MGKHAGDRGRKRGCRVPAQAWETFLTHLRDKSAIEVSKLPGMPSAPAFIKKRKRDPEFAARAAAIMATRRPNNKGHIYSPAIWQQCLVNIGRCGISATSKMPGMPSFAGIYMRFWRDKTFRAAVISARPKGKAHPREALNAQLRNNAIYAAAVSAIPSGLQPADRDDVIADMVLAALEGRLAVADMCARAADFVKSQRRAFLSRNTVSLDEPIFRGGRLTRGDCVSEASP